MIATKAGLIAAALICSTIGAAPAPPAGIRSSGTLVVQATVSGTPLDIGANVALYRKGAMYRLDVLSLGFPGQDKGVSQLLAAQLLGPGGVTLVYDGATGAMTAYSNANRTYYAEPPKTAATSASGSAPSAGGPVGLGDPLRALASVSAALRDVRTASIQILGHPSVNGHPSTDLDVRMERKEGSGVEDYHARLALAEDLDGFPLQVAFQANPSVKGGSGTTGSLKLDLTTIAADAPADNVFAVPAGYTRVSSINDVLRRH